MVPGRSEDHRITFSSIIVAGNDLPGTPKNSPSLHTLPQPGNQGQSLESIHHQWQRGRTWEHKAAHTCTNALWGPETSFLLVWTNPASAFQKDSIWIIQKNESFFLDLKSSPENYVPQSPSLERFLLPSQVLSNGEHSNNNWSQSLWSTHSVPGPVPRGLLTSPHSIPPSTLESRYHYYPHFQRGETWLKEVKYFAPGHPAGKWKSLPSNLS